MSVTGEFLAAARAGSPVWMCTVRAAYGALPPTESWVLQARVLPTAGEAAAYDLRLPLARGLADDEPEFATEYVLGSLFNILSTIGGRRIDFVADGDVEFAQKLTAAFDTKFGIALARKDRHGYASASTSSSGCWTPRPGARGNGSPGR